MDNTVSMTPTWSEPGSSSTVITMFELWMTVNANQVQKNVILRI